MLLLKFVLLFLVNQISFSYSKTTVTKRKFIIKKKSYLPTYFNTNNESYILNNYNYTLRNGPSVSSYVINNKLYNCQESYYFNENVRGCVPISIHPTSHVSLPEHNELLNENTRCVFKPVKNCKLFDNNGIHMPCVEDLYFNTEICACDHQKNVPDCKNNLRSSKPNEPNEPNGVMKSQNPIGPNSGRYVPLVCYVTNWSIYRKEEGKFVFLRDIDPNLCSKIIYAYAGVSNGQLVSFDPNIDITRNGYKDVTSMKNTGRVEEVLLSFPGWTQKTHNAIVSILKGNNNTINKFAKSTADFIKQHNFDGVNLDFEMGYNCNKLTQYVKLLRNYMNKINKTITISVFTNKHDLDNNCANYIVKYSDNILIKSYQLKNREYFGSGWDVDDVKNSVNYVTEYLNIPKNHIYIGIPQWSWSQNANGLTEDVKNLIGRRVILDDKSYEYTNEINRIGNIEFCMLHENVIKYYSNSMTSYQDNNQGLRRIYSITTQKQMIEIRNYIINQGYAGGMVWNLDLSDFNNNCKCRNKYQDLYAFTYNNIDKNCLLY